MSARCVLLWGICSFCAALPCFVCGLGLNADAIHSSFHSGVLTKSEPPVEGGGEMRMVVYGTNRRDAKMLALAVEAAAHQLCFALFYGVGVSCNELFMTAYAQDDYWLKGSLLPFYGCLLAYLLENALSDHLALNTDKGVDR